MTHDFIGHLKTLCMSVFHHRVVALSLNRNATTAHRSAFKKRLVLEYECSLKVDMLFKIMYAQ